MSRARFLACLRSESREGRAGRFDMVMQSPFKCACDPLIQAERRFKSHGTESKQVGFVPLPRAGGVLVRAVVSIGELRRRCQIVEGRTATKRCGEGDAGFVPIQE